MKTQLLQDLNESGSANAKPPPPVANTPPGTAAGRDASARPAVAAAEAAKPATPARAAGPAVWHRPQQDRDTVRAARTEPLRSASPPNPHTAIQPKGFAPQPLPIDATVPLPGGAQSKGGDPDWLAERLARDTALHERPEWSAPWGRRLASWGAAGVLLALVAAGGLWLYEQSQVEGALVVVANTNQAPPSGLAPEVVPRTVPVQPTLPPNAGLASEPVAPAAAPAAAPPLTPTAPAPRDLTPLAQEGAPAQLAPAPAPSTSAVGQSTGASTVAETGEATIERPGVRAVDTSAAARKSEAATSRRGKARASRAGEEQADIAAAKPKHGAAHKRPKTVASATAREGERSGERSYRQRYEETLMQCRAHGYDERQCLQRGCEMTRFGFACKG